MMTIGLALGDECPHLLRCTTVLWRMLSGPDDLSKSNLINSSARRLRCRRPAARRDDAGLIGEYHGPEAGRPSTATPATRWCSSWPGRAGSTWATEIVRSPPAG